MRPIANHSPDRSLSMTSMRERKLPVGDGATTLRPTPAPLMHPDEVMPLKKAVNPHGGPSEATVRRWCRRFPIATQSMPCAPLKISKVAFAMVQANDLRALKRYAEGDRSSALVRRYIDLIGVPVVDDHGLYASLGHDVMDLLE